MSKGLEEKEEVLLPERWARCESVDRRALGSSCAPSPSESWPTAGPAKEDAGASYTQARPETTLHVCTSSMCTHYRKLHTFF